MLHRRHFLALLALPVMGTPAKAQNQTAPASDWDALLKKHVRPLRGGQATEVDYAGFATDRTRLQTWLAGQTKVARVEFDRWGNAEQLAFLINAYNAWTIELVLTGYPRIASIKDLGSFIQSPWKKSFIPLLGETRSLDDIEHGLIRGSGRYNEPRIHFAVNCASIGCPALRAQAYNAAQLEAQLEDATRQFLSDRSRNRFESGELRVSSIFKWYRKDFEQGWRNARSLGQFLALHSTSLGLSAEVASRAAAGQLDIEFLDYDWKLNGVRS
ncbi:MAG: DUF547 domain-containing protein [Rhodoferax sp.]|uniref:DUF547 domain-containing protein n=1 Tax=Rhodoferax sp. TaxID=50421 RepID=UPI001B4B321C|nr:DUF547 domain-containing protein [Rhodoferax sp.]MBP9148659.1 DUF547 domain-containing protein [Rhodoferax sp.]MBP9737561.1 DUF547 domain-containing protein [Rhodoferax sp.]